MERQDGCAAAGSELAREREDGAILLVGQDQAFKRQLPVGRYKVEAKVRAHGDDPPLTARGTLSVTAHEATIEQRLLVRK